jgi:hypothetical protein
MQSLLAGEPMEKARDGMRRGRGRENASVRKRKANIELVGTVEAKENFGIFEAMLRATAQESGDILKVHCFRLLSGPTPIVSEKTTRLGINNQTLEGFGCSGHRLNMETEGGSHQSEKALQQAAKWSITCE